MGGNVCGVGGVGCGVYAVFVFDLYEFGAGDVYLWGEGGWEGCCGEVCEE